MERLGDVHNSFDLQTEQVAVGDAKKSRKRKKSKKEKAISVVEGTQVDITTGLERPGDAQNHLDAVVGLQAEQVTVTNGKKSHKRKKSKKEKAAIV